MANNLRFQVVEEAFKKRAVEINGYDALHPGSPPGTVSSFTL
jgi:hypothetical protein